MVLTARLELDPTIKRLICPGDAAGTPYTARFTPAGSGMVLYGPIAGADWTPPDDWPGWEDSGYPVAEGVEFVIELGPTEQLFATASAGTVYVFISNIERPVAALDFD